MMCGDDLDGVCGCVCWWLCARSVELCVCLSVECCSFTQGCIGGTVGCVLVCVGVMDLSVPLWLVCVVWVAVLFCVCSGSKVGGGVCCVAVLFVYDFSCPD